MDEMAWIFRGMFYPAALAWIIAVVSAVFRKGRQRMPESDRDRTKPAPVNIIIPVKSETLPHEYINNLSVLKGIRKILVVDDTTIQNWPTAVETNGESKLENDKVIRQQIAFNRLEEPEHLVFFLDADIRLEQPIIDEARFRFSRDRQLGLLFFPYNQIPGRKSFYAAVHAHLFNVCTIPVIQWFDIWGQIPGALGGAMVLRVKDVKKNIDWGILRRHLTEDIPMAKMIRGAGLNVKCAFQTVPCVVSCLNRKQFEHIWHRWFMGTRYYIPKTFYFVVFWMFCLHAAGPFVLLYELLARQINVISIFIFFSWYLAIWMGMKKFNLWLKPGIFLATIIIPWMTLKALIFAFAGKTVSWQGKEMKINRDGYLF